MSTLQRHATVLANGTRFRQAVEAVAAVEMLLPPTTVESHALEWRTRRGRVEYFGRIELTQGIVLRAWIRRERPGVHPMLRPKVDALFDETAAWSKLDTLIDAFAATWLARTTKGTPHASKSLDT